MTPRKRGHTPLILGNDQPFLKGRGDSWYKKSRGGGREHPGNGHSDLHSARFFGCRSCATRVLSFGANQKPLPWMDEIRFAPPKRPWNDVSPVSTSKQWFNHGFKLVRNGYRPSTA